MRVLRFASAARAGSVSRPSTLWRPTKCAWMFGRRPGAPCSDTANTSVPWKEALQDTIRLYPSPGDCLRVHSKSLIVAALVMRTSNDRWTSPDPDDGFKEMDEKSGR